MDSWKNFNLRDLMLNGIVVIPQTRRFGIMQIGEDGDDYYEQRFPNGSMSCLFPSIACRDTSGSSISSYEKLPQEPLRLTVRKLDESSFGIEVAKTGTVGELKRAVEAAFCHLPQKGPGRVSWNHVWAQFCLCHEGQKLLMDSDYISMFDIKDADQLRFVYHASNSSISSKLESNREDRDSDDEHCVSDEQRSEYQHNEEDDDDHHHKGVVEENQDDHLESDEGISLCCDLKFSNLLRGCLPYQRLPSSPLRMKKRETSSRYSYKMLGRFKNYMRFSRRRFKFRRVTRKGE